MKGQQAPAFHWAGLILGFALGGFFDGILLHQILQWHHLLSLVPGVDGLARQVLYDGLFHALMYLVAAWGLWLLWRSRRDFARPQAGRLVLTDALIGFGVWNIIDAALAHWVLGIHRIRLDSANPLLWDLIWFVAFGVLPLALGLLWRRRTRGGAGTIGGRPAALGLALAALVGGALAAQPPADTRTAMVVFRPGFTDGEALGAIQRAGGGLLWTSGGVWAVAWRDRPNAAGLYAHGALLVSNSLPGGGCLAWSRV
jgi:uncharacterized membrane protein